MEWQDERAAYLVSKKIEVGRRLAWASIQKGKIDFSVGDRREFALLPEAIDFDQQMYEALKAGIEGQACKIVRRVEPPVHYELEDVRVGLEVSMPFGFEAWRQFPLECWPGSKERCINHMMSSLPVAPASGYGRLRAKMYETEEHIREVDPLKGGRVSEEMKKVVLMKMFFEDLHPHAQL